MAYIWTRATADHRTTAFHFTSQGCSVPEGRSATVRWWPMKWKFGARDHRTNETEAEWAFVGKPIAPCFGDCGKTVASCTWLMDIRRTMLVCSSLTFVIICINKVRECKHQSQGRHQVKNCKVEFKNYTMKLKSKKFVKDWSFHVPFLPFSLATYFLARQFSSFPKSRVYV